MNIKIFCMFLDIRYIKVLYLFLIYSKFIPIAWSTYDPHWLLPTVHCNLCLWLLLIFPIYTIYISLYIPPYLESGMWWLRIATGLKYFWNTSVDTMKIMKIYSNIPQYILSIPHFPQPVPMARRVISRLIFRIFFCFRATENYHIFPVSMFPMSVPSEAIKYDTLPLKSGELTRASINTVKSTAPL